MAHWAPVYNNEDYEAEIQVGVYDQWLRQLEFGPTQADRVLVHTDMMEHAHERRFAVCQAGIDMSRFEAEHSRRIKLAVDHVQLRFTTYTSREVSEDGDCSDAGLIGLRQCPAQPTLIDCSQFATYSDPPQTTLVQKDLTSMLFKARERNRKRARTPTTCPLADADPSSADDEDYVHLQKEIYGEVLAARKKARAMSSVGALQMKPIRYRRVQGSTNKASSKRHSCVGPPSASLV